MSRSVEIEVSSTVRTGRAQVWDVVTTMDGVNAELAPWVCMTAPAGISLADLDERGDLAPGEVVMHSWVLALRVLPVDRHAFGFEGMEAGRSFAEESSSWMQRRWRHVRTLDDTPSGGCVVTDRLVVEPRIGLVAPMAGWLVRKLFEHRHRRLRARFGAG